MRPPFQAAISDNSGLVSKEWRRYLTDLNASAGGSSTTSQDVQFMAIIDSTDAQATAQAALNLATANKTGLASLKAEVELLAWWPA